MARYNKIYAGPVSQVTPQVQEAPAAAAVKPGSMVVLTSGEFAAATADTVGKVFIAQDNYLAMKGVDHDYAEGDVVIGMEMLDEQFFHARVSTGNDLTKGTALTPGANGHLVLAGDGDMVVAFSEETFNNNTGESQLVRVRAAKGYLTPAGA